MLLAQQIEVMEAETFEIVEIDAADVELGSRSIGCSTSATTSCSTSCGSTTSSSCSG